MQKEIIFHVGLPKAASTYLQRKVFPVFKNVRFVKKHNFKNHEKIINDSEQTVILSTEMDIGKGYEHSKKLYQIADKYPGTKVILVLRRHDKWIASKYKYHIRKGNSLDFREFFNLENDSGHYKIEHLIYSDIINKIKDFFNSEPLVIFQEELKNNPEKVLHLIADYCGAEFDYNSVKSKKVNTAFSEKQLLFLLNYNKKFKPADNNKVLRKLSSGLIHILAFISNYFPAKKYSDRELIPSRDLEKIKKYFEKDWQKCIAEVSEKRKIFNDIN